MKVEDILESKGSKVVTVRPHETIRTLVHKLKLERIGAVIVSEDGVTPDGIVSERDIVNGLAAHGSELLEMTVADTMTHQLATCRPGDGVKDVMAKMTTRRVRHLPVMEGDKLVGVISIGDVVKNRLDDMELEAGVLRDFAASR